MQHHPWVIVQTQSSHERPTVWLIKFSCLTIDGPSRYGNPHRPLPVAALGCRSYGPAHRRRSRQSRLPRRKCHVPTAAARGGAAALSCFSICRCEVRRHVRPSVSGPRAGCPEVEQNCRQCMESARILRSIALLATKPSPIACVAGPEGGVELPRSHLSGRVGVGHQAV